MSEDNMAFFVKNISLLINRENTSFSLKRQFSFKMLFKNIIKHPD
ncbi:hypothetical protein HDF22_005864 [Mucilaginibacter lappiensis]|uniref:Uncharacterized protein n=1 Tax=Mucilaginibacter lappiensis TaxID=354630 RepID=A0A841JKK4_9SPHI|nr:hypothetical protein [Mucilaginibacter lappiensis]